MTGKPIFGQLLKVANSAAARFHEAIGKGAVEIPGLQEPGGGRCFGSGSRFFPVHTEKRFFLNQNMCSRILKNPPKKKRFLHTLSKI